MFFDLKIKKGVIWGVFLTLIFTLPVVFNFFSEIPGRGADTYQAIGRTVMVENQIEKIGVWNTFKWQKEENFWGILPLIGYTQAIFGRFSGYNLWWLASFFLAFLGMWILVKDITKSDWGAVVSGFIFAFSPFHFSQALATNIGTMHYEWLVWLVFFLYRFFKEVSLRAALGVFVTLILVIATEHQLLAFIMLFLIFLVPFLMFAYPKSLKRGMFWATVSFGLTIAFIVGSIQFRSVWEISKSEDNFLKPPYSQVEDYSADFLDILLPARFQSFWGESFNEKRQNMASNIEGRQSFYLGYVALFLFFLSFVLIFRQKEFFSKKEKRFSIFFFLISLIFIVLSFGPTLHVGGDVFLEKKMPYLWVYENIPFWNMIRTTSRIFLIALLGFAFVSSLGVKFFEEKYKKMPTSARIDQKIIGFFDYFFGKTKNLSKREFHKRRLKELETKKQFDEKKNVKFWSRIFLNFVLILIFIVLPLEYLAIPVETMDLKYSAFYDKIKSEEGAFKVLDVPGSTSYNFASYALYTSQIHGKQKIDGMDFARAQKEYWSFQKNTPIINTLLYSLPTGGVYNPAEKTGDIIISDYTPFGKSILNFFNIRYITLSKVKGGEKFNQSAFQNEENYIKNILGLSLEHEDDFLKAFGVPEEVRAGHFLSLDTTGDAWGEKTGGGTSRAREAKSGAKLSLVNLEEKPINVDFSFKAKVSYLRSLEIILNGQMVKKIDLNDFNAEYTVPLAQVPPGNNIMEFVIKDQDGVLVQDYSLDRSIKFSKLRTIQK